MTGTSRFVVAAGHFCLAVAPQAAADPIRIQSGSLLVTGRSEPGAIDVSGTRGFSLVFPPSIRV